MKCAVITPVGPGHRELYREECLRSIRQAVDRDRGPFDEIVPLALDDTEGRHGRSARRNDGIEECRRRGVDWIFFLDADDRMHPDAFRAFEPHAADRDAVWGRISEIDPGGGTPREREGQIGATDDLRNILVADPFHSLQMGHFVRTEAAARVGFDTGLDAGEDFKYYLEVWKTFRCIRTDGVLFHNRRGNPSRGPRSASGADWRAGVGRVFLEFCLANPMHAGVVHRDVPVRFRIASTLDRQHRHFMLGRFDDAESLAALEDRVGEGGAIVEVGAGVGGHAVYLGRFLRPRSLLCIEPGSPASRLLEENLSLNGLEAPHVRTVTVAAGDREGRAEQGDLDPFDLGATRVRAGRPGPIEVRPLDALVQGHVDLLKIDVAGAAPEVLAGARATIDRCRPVLAVHDAEETLRGVVAWAGPNRYVVQREAGPAERRMLLLEPESLRGAGG